MLKSKQTQKNKPITFGPRLSSDPLLWLDSNNNFVLPRFRQAYVVFSQVNKQSSAIKLYLSSGSNLCKVPALSQCSYCCGNRFKNEKN